MINNKLDDSVLISIYNDDIDNRFNMATVDSNNNIICIGRTGTGKRRDSVTLIVKFDSDLNVVSKTTCGDHKDFFIGVVTDSNDNIICVGRTTSDVTCGGDILMMKFDSDLMILNINIYDDNDIDWFNAVTIDANDNIICVGRTIISEVYTALVVKYDSDFNVVARKTYSGDDSWGYFNQAVMDSTGNIICIGSTDEGSASGIRCSDTLMVKYDSDLNVVVNVVYGGTDDGSCDRFSEVAIDSNDDIICIGYISSEDSDSSDALMVKFSGTDLSLIVKKTYGDDYGYFHGVATCTNNDIICIGSTFSDNDWYTLVVKLDNSLNVLDRKIYDGDDEFSEVATDTNDDIICIGRTTSELPGSSEYPNRVDALIVKYDKWG
jgi:hypothetical protein